MASKVYWADLRTDYRENLPQKLTRLMKTAGMGQIDFEGKFTASSCTSASPATWPSCGPTGPRPWRTL